MVCKISYNLFWWKKTFHLHQKYLAKWVRLMDHHTMIDLTEKIINTFRYISAKIEFDTSSTLLEHKSRSNEQIKIKSGLNQQNLEPDLDQNHNQNNLSIFLYFDTICSDLIHSSSTFSSSFLNYYIYKLIITYIFLYKTELFSIKNGYGAFCCKAN